MPLPSAAQRGSEALSCLELQLREEMEKMITDITDQTINKFKEALPIWTPGRRHRCSSGPWLQW